MSSSLEKSRDKVRQQQLLAQGSRSLGNDDHRPSTSGLMAQQPTEFNVGVIGFESNENVDRDTFMDRLHKEIRNAKQQEIGNANQQDPVTLVVPYIDGIVNFKLWKIEVKIGKWNVKKLPGATIVHEKSFCKGYQGFIIPTTNDGEKLKKIDNFLERLKRNKIIDLGFPAFTVAMNCNMGQVMETLKSGHINRKHGIIPSYLLTMGEQTNPQEGGGKEIVDCLVENILPPVVINARVKGLSLGQPQAPSGSDTNRGGGNGNNDVGPGSSKQSIQEQSSASGPKTDFRIDTILRDKPPTKTTGHGPGAYQQQPQGYGTGAGSNIPLANAQQRARPNNYGGMLPCNPTPGGYHMMGAYSPTTLMNRYGTGAGSSILLANVQQQALPNIYGSMRPYYAVPGYAMMGANRPTTLLNRYAPGAGSNVQTIHGLSQTLPNHFGSMNAYYAAHAAPMMQYLRLAELGRSLRQSQAPSGPATSRGGGIGNRNEGPGSSNYHERESRTRRPTFQPY